MHEDYPEDGKLKLAELQSFYLGYMTSAEIHMEEATVIEAGITKAKTWCFLLS